VEEHPCPNRSSERRRYNIKVGGVVEPHGNLKIKQKDLAGFVKVVSWVKNKVSGASKRHAKEEMRIDRSDPEFTQKLHHVEEATESGEYEVVHHEDQKFPAKRRP
jgi:hypothetical protein